MITPDSREIPVGTAVAGGELSYFLGARSVVLAHDNGRQSSRNQVVSKYLHKRHSDTLFFDLLTEAEAQNYACRFYIDLLIRQLVVATEWLQEQPEVRGLTFSYLGARTGYNNHVWVGGYRVGGRPAGPGCPSQSWAPIVQIVGSHNGNVLSLNRQAAAWLGGYSNAIQ